MQTRVRVNDILGNKGLTVWGLIVGNKGLTAWGLIDLPKKGNTCINGKKGLKANIKGNKGLINPHTQF